MIVVDMVCVCVCVRSEKQSFKITFVLFSHFSRAGWIEAGFVLGLPGACVCLCVLRVDVTKHSP